MRFAIVAAALLLPTAVGSLVSQDTENKVQAKAPSVAKALQVGADLLVKLQEKYTKDRRVGRLRDNELRDWQESERKRLAKDRAENNPGVEWPYEGVYRVGGIIPPGYRVGGSAIVCTALVLSPKFEDSEDRKAAVSRSIDFMLDELKDNERLAPGPKRGYDVRGWGHTYALDLFLLVKRRKLLNERAGERVDKMIPHLLKCLATNETAGGGWNYANNTCSPFMTGSTLLTLYHARKQGYKVDEAMVERALTGLERARIKTGSYVYSGTATGRRATGSRAAMPGASARAAVAELSLFQAGRSDVARLRVAVNAFFEHWGELLKRKSQQGTHMGPYGIAPYYFMYGHTYAALAIEVLPEKERPALRKKMQETLWKTREADGGWNDRIFPRSKAYSTAMAMLALMAPKVEAIPVWAPSTGAGESTKKKGEIKKQG